MTRKATEPDLFAGLPVAAINMAIDLHEEADDAPQPKKGGAFRSISEAARLLSLPQHVLRFWESKFAIIKPVKLRGGRRYYRPQDIETIARIKELLYKEGYTIPGARKAIASRKKGDVMEGMQSGKRAKRKMPVMSEEEAPLFAALLDSASAPKAATLNKQDLNAIYAELMELQAMVGKLKAHA